MNPTLTDEQRSALDARPDWVEVEDSETHKLYVLTDADAHREAVEALHRLRDLESVAAGLADLDAGRTRPLPKAEDWVCLTDGEDFPPAS